MFLARGLVRACRRCRSVVVVGPSPSLSACVRSRDTLALGHDRACSCARVLPVYYFFLTIIYVAGTYRNARPAARRANQFQPDPPRAGRPPEPGADSDPHAAFITVQDSAGRSTFAPVVVSCTRSSWPCNVVPPPQYTRTTETSGIFQRRAFEKSSLQTDDARRALKSLRLAVSGARLRSECTINVAVH